MCAASSSINSSKSSTPTTKQVPKCLKMKQQNKSSYGKTAKPTVQKSSGSAQKPQQESRNAKRARWAKKAKPVAKSVAKPVVKRGPVKEYISVCCSVPAQKPPCGTKVASIDPETGRPAKKDKVTGLGHWRCPQCRKSCKVEPQATKPKDNPYLKPEDKAKIEALGNNTIGSSFPDVVYPGKLTTPVIMGTVEGSDLGRGTAVVGNGRPEVTSGS